MRCSVIVVLVSGFLVVRPAFAENPLDCGKRSLADAVASLGDKALVIKFTGLCAGPIVIDTDGVTLEGVGDAVIDGGTQDAVTITGAARVTLASFEVRHGRNGIVADNGAHLSLTDMNVHGNAASGISLRTGSTAVIRDVTIAENGLHGLDVQGGSAIRVNGTLNATSNQVFGISVNGSSLTMAKATVAAIGNVVGVQIGTNANAFIDDSSSVINANNNLATGLTVVSGSHLVSFGGTINASGNAGVGVSVNSKSGLDLDAGSTLDSSGNGDGVLIQQNSVMTVFNNPQFSGAPGFSTVSVRNNTRTGLRVLNEAVITVSNQARVDSRQNGTVGFVGDNGAAATLVNSTITGNVARDIQLTFGTRVDLQSLTFGSYSCDATVLVRGTSGIICPH